MERARTTAMPGQVGSGVERIDRSSSMRRIQPGSGSAPAQDARSSRQAEHGDGRAPYLNSVSINEARRRGNDNPDNERETTWKGLVSNDIYYIWNHGPKYGGGFDCRYCHLISRGGGATRFREHLGGIPGEVRECPNVPRNVRAAMRDSRDDARRKKREKKNRRLRLERDIMEGLYHGEGVINIEEDDDERIQTALWESLRDKNVSRAVERRRGSGSGVRVSLGKQCITAYFDKELSSNKVSMHPKISTALNVDSEDVLGQAWAKFFHANDIAGLKANCPYFRAAVKITQNLGPAPVPTAKEIDGIYLDKNYEEAEQWLKMFKEEWRNYGVTVMCDSWTGPTGMCLINFMVYCNAQVFFHKSIDASGQTQTADAIEKIADPETVVLAIDEVSTYRECCGRFGQRLARSSAEKMSPTQWWFQFGGEVPNLQKCALRIVSQCVSSSGCERNWSPFALVHTKQRNRLLYGKVHKLVSVRYNLKIRAEEDQDPVRENDKQKEVDACAMMMDTTMFDATNPMMEWLNEDDEHVILDGVDAASAVFEQIRLLNSSRKASHLGRKDNARKRKRVEEEEDDYNDSEDDDEENEELEIDDGNDSHDDGASQSDGGDSAMQVEKDLPSQVGNNAEVKTDGSLVNRRSERVRQANKVKEVTSLYN